MFDSKSLPNPAITLSQPKASEDPAASLPSAERPADHLFVDNVRFLSMAAIVALHCIGILPPLCGLSSSSRAIPAMLQPLKFGTIGFFLISGFLMGEGLSRSTSSAYLMRRLKKVFAPWLVWVAFYLGLLLTRRVLAGRLSVNSFHDSRMLRDLLQIALFDTPYWFVPNLMLAIGVLLLCRRFLYDPRLGCVLLGVSLFYGINAYTQWLPLQSHTEALFGFVFYLWLGAWVAKHFQTFESWTARIPALALIATAALTGFAAFGEGELLSQSGALNTLRISNQIYSVVMVLAIFKARRALWPRALNVRKSTFGVYLAHSVVLALLVSLGTRFMVYDRMRTIWGANKTSEALLLAGAFIATYMTSLAITFWLLAHPHLCWMVGGSKFERSQKRPAQEKGRAPREPIQLRQPPFVLASNHDLPPDLRVHGD